MPLSDVKSSCLTIAIVFCLLGCKNKQQQILPIDKMKVVFLHQIMAEEVVNLHYAHKDTTPNLDSMYITSFEKVLKLNKTDSATFYKSLNYYKADIKLFKELLDSTQAYATQLRTRAYQPHDTSSGNTGKEDSQKDSVRFKYLQKRPNR